MTALAEQLKTKAANIVRQSRLFMLAVQKLNDHRNNPAVAKNYLVDAIRNDLGSIRELCGSDLQALIERKAYEYLQRRVEDLSGSSQGCNALDGQAPVTAPLKPSWSPADIKGLGQPHRANGQASIAQSQPSPESGRSASANGQVKGATSQVDRFTPNPKSRGIGAIASVQPAIEKGLLDTYRVRDGRIIGSLMLKEVRTLIAQNKLEAAILEQIRDHTANGAPSDTVRDIISDDSLKTFIDRAKALYDDEQD